MERLQCEAIAKWCGGKLNGYGEVTAVVTDSRKIVSGCLFVALKGEKFDGHDFIDEAYANGAVGVLSEKVAKVPKGCFIILVSDTLKAFAKIAQGYRSLFHIPVVGVTGSVGKTSTKEYIASVLSQKYETLKTQGNLNNEIGLPSMALQLEKKHEAAVFEMGMSDFGEIERLSTVCRPDIGVITNIGVAHIERLGSREGILQAKLEITAGMPKEGVLVLNGDEPLLFGKKGKLPFKTVYFGINNKECDYVAQEIAQTEDGQEFTVSGCEGMRFAITQKGRHHVYNALCAYVCGILLEVSSEDCQKGLLAYGGQKMRQHIFKAGDKTIIDDTYNANPDSMKAALSVLGGYKAQKIAVLGDMLELGDYSCQGHYDVGKFAKEQSVDYILVKGPQMKACIKAASQAGMADERLFSFDSDEPLVDALQKIWQPGAVVLFKGSRGMRMEKAMELAVKGENDNG